MLCDSESPIFNLLWLQYSAGSAMILRRKTMHKQLYLLDKYPRSISVIFSYCFHRSSVETFNLDEVQHPSQAIRIPIKTFELFEKTYTLGE